MIRAMHISGRLAAILAVLVIATIAGVLLLVRAADNGPVVETATVTRGTIETTVELAGTVEAADTRQVVFATGGTVAEVTVAEGDRVAAADVLATLDATQLQAQLAAAEATLASAQARLAADLAGPSPARRTAARDPITQAEQSLANARRAQRSFESAFRIRALAREIGISKVYAVGNRVTGKQEEDFIEQNLADLRVLGFIPYDQKVVEADQKNYLLWDYCPQSYGAVRKIREQIG